LANDRLKALVAQQAAAGQSTMELARLHNYTYEGMRNLLGTPEMVEMVRQERETFAAAGVRAMFRFLMHADALVDAQIADALDRNNPNHYKARTWILERVAPAPRERAERELNVNLAISQEVAVGLTSALEGIREVQSQSTMGEVRLIEGKKALPRLTGTE
jgi:hypothetical protein